MCSALPTEPRHHISLFHHAHTPQSTATTTRARGEDRRSFPSFVWEWHRRHKQSIGGLHGHLGVLRPFHNETHAGSSVYFETKFAYFADVIKRTLEMFPRTHLNPVGHNSFLQRPQQPAIILSLQGKPMACCFPAAHSILTIPRLTSEGGSAGSNRIKWLKSRCPL